MASRNRPHRAGWYSYSESARAKLDDYRAQEASGAEKRRLMEAVLAWAREVGQGLDELTPEQRREILQIIVRDFDIPCLDPEKFADR